MKKIKTLGLTGFLTLAVFSTIGYSSCSKDKCKDVVCNNGGTCVDGSCQCPLGFEGGACETKSVTKFAGIYEAVDNCPLGDRSGGELKYSISILPVNSDPSKATIVGIGNTDQSVTAEISKDGRKMEIPEQVKDGTTFKGSVEFKANGVLTMNFETRVDNIPQEACSSTLTK